MVDFTDNSIILFSFFLDFIVFTTNANKVILYCVCLWKIQNNYRFCFGICGIYAIFEFFGFCKSVLFWENEKVYFFDVFFWKDFRKSEFSKIAGIWIYNEHDSIVLWFFVLFLCIDQIPDGARSATRFFLAILPVIP